MRTTAELKMYFTKTDADADVNYVLIPAPAAETPYGEWQGPAEIESIWLKATVSAVVEMVYFQRRG